MASYALVSLNVVAKTKPDTIKRAPAHLAVAMIADGVKPERFI